jgi:hypothetical protein
MKDRSTSYKALWKEVTHYDPFNVPFLLAGDYQR